MDLEDGLLILRKPRLTWMDAQNEFGAITPRESKRIEINALWCNLLFKLVKMGKEFGEDVREYEQFYHMASTAMKKFYSHEHGHLLDGIEPQDFALRPNQLWAIALREICKIEKEDAHKSLMKVKDKLWVAGYGLRTLSQDDKNYIGEYRGDMKKRDMAYHQGTIWPWLSGIYAQAISEVAPQMINQTLCEFENLLEPKEGALLSLCEVYDPKTLNSGGCPSQAWSVAECLRGYMILAKKSEQTKTTQHLKPLQVKENTWEIEK